MRLRYLGTAAAEGWPALFCNCEACKEARRRGGKNIRSRQQAILNDNLLFDLCPDTYMHSIQYDLDLSKIHTLLMTHTHHDHHTPYELTMRSSSLAKAPAEDILHIYGNECVIADIRQKLGDKFTDRIEYNYVPAFAPFSSGEYTVTALSADHMVSQPEEHCYLYIVEGEGKRMLYGHDTGLFPADTMEYIKGMPFDLVSLDCTGILIETEGTHMGISAVLKQIDRLKKAGCAKEDTVYVISHFSHHGIMPHEELTEKMAPYGVLVAYDGMTIDF